MHDNDMVAITINSVNDAPSGADNTVTGSEDDPYVFTAADFGFTDPVEGQGFLAVRSSTPSRPTGDPVPGSGRSGRQRRSIFDARPGRVRQRRRHQCRQALLPAPSRRVRLRPMRASPSGAGRWRHAQWRRRHRSDANTITINITPDKLPPAVDLDGAGAGRQRSGLLHRGGAGRRDRQRRSPSPTRTRASAIMIESATITLTDAVAGDELTVRRVAGRDHRGHHASRPARS